MLYFFLKKNRVGWSDLGLVGRGVPIKPLIVGIVSGLLWLAFNKWVYHPFIIHYLGAPLYTDYDFIRHHPLNLFISIAAAWLVGGLYEELVFRGFARRVLESFTGNSNGGFWIAAIAGSLLFGLYHFQQGIFGIAGSAMGGLYWRLLMRRFSENIWYPIFSHAVFDTGALLLIYYSIPL
ncbi:CPBP family intramembrane glutamic endopeptidase [Flaviaesturariibacter terrae]